MRFIVVQINSPQSGCRYRHCCTSYYESPCSSSCVLYSSAKLKDRTYWRINKLHVQIIPILILQWVNVYLCFCSTGSKTLASMVLAGCWARCGEVSSSEGWSPGSAKLSPKSADPPPPSLLPLLLLFWKRSEKVLRNFCNTLSALPRTFRT